MDFAFSQQPLTHFMNHWEYDQLGKKVKSTQVEQKRA